MKRFIGALILLVALTGTAYADFVYKIDRAYGTNSSAINSTDAPGATFTVSNGSVSPAWPSTPFTVVMYASTCGTPETCPSVEFITISNVSGSTFTIGARAQGGTSALYWFISSKITEAFSSATAAAPTTAKYILQQTNGSLPNAQAMSALATGLVKNTTSTGMLSIGAAGTDFQAPIAVTPPIALAGVTLSCLTATGAQTGCITSTDWTNHQLAYTNRITSAVSPLSITSNALSLGTVPVAKGGTGFTDTTFSGTTHKLATVSGATTNAHAASWDVNGNLADGGVLATGNVSGPGATTDNFIPQWNGTGGILLRTGLLFDVDGTLTANSPTRVPSQSAVKTYADALVSSFSVTGEIWATGIIPAPYLVRTVKNSGYAAFGGANFVRYILPNIISNGDYIDVVGHGSGGWGITQDVSGNNMKPWLIRYGATSTTACTGVKYTNQYDTIRLRGFNASNPNDWTVANNYGTIASYASWQAYDAFTDSNITLASHTEDCTHTWTKYAAAGSGTAAIAGNQVDPSSTASYYYNSLTPGTADYSVAVDCYITGTGSLNDFCGPIGRANTGANTYYQVTLQDAGFYSLSKMVAGVSTVFEGGIFDTSVQTFPLPSWIKVKLTMTGTSISGSIFFYSTGATITTAIYTDSDIAAAGKAGIGGNNTSGKSFMDNFSVQ
jgi:hypothetical protein